MWIGEIDKNKNDWKKKNPPEYDYVGADSQRALRAVWRAVHSVSDADEHQIPGHFNERAAHTMGTEMTYLELKGTHTAKGFNWILLLFFIVRSVVSDSSSIHASERLPYQWFSYGISNRKTTADSIFFDLHS